MGERLHRQSRSERPTEEVGQEHPAKQAGRVAVEGANGSEAENKVMDSIDELLEELDEEGLDKDTLDKLFDEIDQLLEPNAEEFVENFQQRNGQ